MIDSELEKDTQAIPSRTVARIGIAFMIVISILNLLWVLVQLPFQIPRSPNEGWNAIHAMLAMGHRPLYPPADSFMFNNYPPLSFYIVGLFGLVTGDDIIAGRIISLLAILAIATNVALTVRNLGGTTLFGIFAGSLWVGIVTKSFTRYVGMDEPQLLAHAVMTTGFTIFTSAQRTRNVAAAAFVMVLAGFIKHNIFAMPLAITTWLLQNNRRLLVPWIGFASAFVCIGFAACALLYGAAFFEQMTSPRTYRFYNVIEMAGLIQAFAIPLVLWMIFALRTPSDPQIRLVNHLLVAGGIAYLATRIGEGVNMNSLFDWAIGSCVAAGLMLSRLSTSPRLSLLRQRYDVALIVGLLCLRMIVLPQNELVGLVRHPAVLAGLRALEADYRQDIAVVKAHQGPALCENLAICYWSGQEAAAFDFFNTWQAVLTGKRDLHVLERQIADGKFRVLQVGQFDLQGNFELGARMSAQDPLLAAARASGLKEQPAAAGGVLFTSDAPR